MEKRRRIEDVVIGELLPDNKVDFGYTDNGCCYKDYNAYKTGEGICYIPECGVDDNDQIDTSYTRAKIIEVVTDYLKSTDQFKSDEHAEIIAYDIFDTCDWQCIETYMVEMEVCDDADDPDSEVVHEYKSTK